MTNIAQSHKDLGIVSTKLSNDQRTSEMVGIARKYFDTNPFSQVCFFSSFCDIISHNNIPVLHLSQAKFFYGNLLITEIKDLDLCISFPNIYKILFFASNIPWESESRSYKDWESIFYQSNVQIIAKNQKIYDIFSICYKEPLTIIERLDHEKIQECL